MMETVGRKLSRKFSGITDILERKMKSGRYYDKRYHLENLLFLDKLKTQHDEEEAMRKKTDESALLFGLL